MLFILVIVAGTLGYVLIEDADPLSALYMTVITVSSVGYAEAVSVEDPAGRIFTMVIIMSGLASWTFFTLSLITFLVEGEFRKQLRKRRMEKTLESMEDHFIICGLGQAGTSSLKEFLAVGARCVVIEKNPATIEDINERYPDLVAIHGDATTDEVLARAGVERARGLIAATESDSDNLLITLTARSKNSDMVITSRAARSENFNKLRIAGANHVVMPNVTGGMRMAATQLRPDAVNFLEVMIRGTGDVLRIEQADIPPGSHAVGKTLMDLAIPNKTGLLVLAIMHENGDYTFNPKPAEKIQAGDVLIVMGKFEQLPELKKILGIKSLGASQESMDGRSARGKPYQARGNKYKRPEE